MHRITRITSIRQFNNYVHYINIHLYRLISQLIIKIYFWTRKKGNADGPYRYISTMLDCYCIDNSMMYTLYLPPLSTGMWTRFSVWVRDKQAMHCCLYMRTITASTRFSINCVYPCGCVAGGSNSFNAERSG